MSKLSGWRTRIRRGPLPLRWRVAVAFALVSMVVAALFALVTFKLAASYMLDQREQSALRQAQVNQRLVSDTLRSQPSDNLGELLKGLSGSPDTTVALSTDGNWVIRGRHVDTTSLPAGIHRLVNSHAAGLERATIEGVPVLAVALPIENTSSMYVELFGMLELEQTIGFLRAVLVGGVAISTVLGFTLGHWASRRALRPLAELTTAAARVARGDLHARLPEHADADLAGLAASFNRTAGDLERRVRQDARFAADVSHELRSPLTTMLNAVAVLRRRRGELSPAGRQALDLLGADVQRFHRMVVDLLEISRGDHDPDNRELETCDLAKLVRHAMASHATA
ncbi:MAG: HAMP domain-containing protein, partial [Pseudonocardia sp.]|nr:HAMP domain-containing protein [Pseudonocardia sp.]